MDYIGKPVEQVLQECKEQRISCYVSTVDGKPTGVIITANYNPARVGLHVRNGLVESIKRG